MCVARGQIALARNGTTRPVLTCFSWKLAKILLHVFFLAEVKPLKSWKRSRFGRIDVGTRDFQPWPVGQLSLYPNLMNDWVEQNAPILQYYSFYLLMSLLLHFVCGAEHRKLKGSEDRGAQTRPIFGPSRE
jgi:hypothetical protein